MARRRWVDGPQLDWTYLLDSGARLRYLPRHPSDEEIKGAEMAGNRLLDAAVSLDYSACVLIRYLLSAAAQEAAGKVVPWLDAAIDAEADVVLELRIVEFVSGGTKVPGAEEVARKALLDKIEKLERFSQLSTAVAAELRS